MKIKIGNEVVEIKIIEVLEFYLIMFVFCLLFVGFAAIGNANSRYEYIDYNQNYVIVNHNGGNTTAVDLNSILIKEEKVINGYKHMVVSYGLVVIDENNHMDYYQNYLLINKETRDVYYKIGDYWTKADPNSFLDKVDYHSGIAILDNMKGKEE